MTKMTVYVLSAQVKYEGEYVLGVYSSVPAASKAAQEHYDRKRRVYDAYIIASYPVDGKPQWRLDEQWESRAQTEGKLRWQDCGEK